MIMAIVFGLISRVLGDICTAASYGPPYMRKYTTQFMLIYIYIYII